WPRPWGSSLRPCTSGRQATERSRPGSRSPLRGIGRIWCPCTTFAPTSSAPRRTSRRPAMLLDPEKLDRLVRLQECVSANARQSGEAGPRLDITSLERTQTELVPCARIPLRTRLRDAGYAAFAYLIGRRARTPG